MGSCSNQYILKVFLFLYTSKFLWCFLKVQLFTWLEFQQNQTIFFNLTWTHHSSRNVYQTALDFTVFDQNFLLFCYSLSILSHLLRRKSLFVLSLLIYRSQQKFLHFHYSLSSKINFDQSLNQFIKVSWKLFYWYFTPYHFFANVLKIPLTLCLISLSFCLFPDLYFSNSIRRCACVSSMFHILILAFTSFFSSIIFKNFRWLLF